MALGPSFPGRFVVDAFFVGSHRILLASSDLASFDNDGHFQRTWAIVAIDAGKLDIEMPMRPTDPDLHEPDEPPQPQPQPPTPQPPVSPFYDMTRVNERYPFPAQDQVKDSFALRIVDSKFTDDLLALASDDLV